MILVFLDDVMRSPKGGALYEGLALYRLFKENTKVTILCKDTADAERWCKQNNILKTDDFVDHAMTRATEDHDLRMVEFCRARGGVQLVVTGDVELSKKLLQAGIHSLLFLHPIYMREEFRPDSRQGIKSWGDITSEIDRQIEMLAADPRQ